MDIRKSPPRNGEGDRSAKPSGGGDGLALTGTSRTVVRARQLRRDMSFPEVLLWKELKKRPGGHKFRRQHPAGVYILDFVCMASKLAIEVDGAHHDGEGRHFSDIKRDKWLDANGCRTVRIAAKDVLNDMDGVIAYLVDQCSASNPLHHPADGPPPPAGEEMDN